MKILVLGSEGQIGRPLCAYLTSVVTNLDSCSRSTNISKVTSDLLMHIFKDQFE